MCRKEDYKQAYKVVRLLDHADEWLQLDQYFSDHGYSDHSVSMHAWRWMRGGVEHVTRLRLQDLDPVAVDAAWRSFYMSSWRDRLDRSCGYYAGRRFVDDIPF